MGRKCHGPALPQGLGGGAGGVLAGEQAEHGAAAAAEQGSQCAVGAEGALDVPYGAVRWDGAFEAVIERGGHSADILRRQRGGRLLLCRIYGGGVAKFELTPMEGTTLTRLTVRVPVREKLRLAVAFAMTDTPDAKLYDLQPMTKWVELQ